MGSYGEERRVTKEEGGRLGKRRGGNRERNTEEEEKDIE